MARRATLFKQERENNDGLVLYLDAGSSLMGQWVSLKSKGEAIVETMNAMGYDAMTVGRMDLSSGLENLQERQKQAEFPILSANLVPIEGNEPIFEPYTLIEREGIRIGIIGLSEQEAFQAPGVTDKARVLDPTTVAKRYVAELRDQVDLLIVLSRIGLDNDQLLAQAVPGIDIIIGGNTRKLMNKPERVGNTLIVQQGYRGEWVGKLTASFDGKGVLAEFKEEIITLDDKFADDPEMVEIMKPWRALYPTPTPRPTYTPTPGPSPTPVTKQ